MTGKLRARLFLQNREKEQIMSLVDKLLDEDIETEEDAAQNQLWAEILTRLVLGKINVYPLYLAKGPDEIEGKGK